MDWCRRVMAVVEPDRTLGAYANGNADAGPEETRRIYGDAKVARLAALKRDVGPRQRVPREPQRGSRAGRGCTRLRVAGRAPPDDGPRRTEKDPRKVIRELAERGRALEWIVDVDGNRLVIDGVYRTSDPVETAQIMEIIDSITFGIQ